MGGAGIKKTNFPIRPPAPPTAVFFSGEKEQYSSRTTSSSSPLLRDPSSPRQLDTTTVLGYRNPLRKIAIDVNACCQVPLQCRSPLLFPFDAVLVQGAEQSSIFLLASVVGVTFPVTFPVLVVLFACCPMTIAPAVSESTAQHPSSRGTAR